MPKTLLPTGRQFEFPEERNEVYDDEDVVELHSGYWAYRSDYRAYYPLQAASFSRSDSEVERFFDELVEEWQEGTKFSSSLTDMVLHPAYQRVIGMGPEAVPMILRELQHRPAQWFWALRSITGEDPVDPEDAGRVRKMAEAWLDWGRKRGYL